MNRLEAIRAVLLLVIVISLLHPWVEQRWWCGAQTRRWGRLER